MTVAITVSVQRLDGILKFKLSAVTSSDVSITFASSSVYDFAAIAILKNRIAQKLSGYADITQTFPTSSEVNAMITERLIAFAGNLTIPFFTPQPPGPDEVDLTAFVPMTINQQVLALQLSELSDGTVCDTPDVFAKPTGFSLAISAAESNRLIKPIRDNNMGDRTEKGYDMTVESLNITLSDPGTHNQTRGHLWVDGSVEVHVDCWFDPTIGFWGPIFLNPTTTPDGNVIFTAEAGNFGADDSCCEDVDPSDIASLISGTQSTPMVLPSNFSGVGSLDLSVTSADIFAAGIVINGDFTIHTSAALHTGEKRKTIYWFNEPAGGP